MPLSTILRAAPALAISLSTQLLTLALALTTASAPALAHHATGIPEIGSSSAAMTVSGGHGGGHGEIEVTASFARASAGPARNGAVYFVVENRAGHPDRLIGARAEISTKAELHTHLHEGGVMKMRPVEAIEVPAHGSVQLKPGGDHVMLTGLSTPLVEGQSFSLTLVFEKAGEVEVTVTIGGVGAMHAPAGHGGHGGHKN